MKIVLIGCVKSSLATFETLVRLEEQNLVGVVTRERASYNADHCSLAEAARVARVPVLIADNRSESEIGAWIRLVDPDAIYCVGWPRILGHTILSIPQRGVIGYHPTALPRNRGRHPIIWTLVLGLQETASTFFMMDEGVDSGPIISQERIRVDDDDDAGSLYEKLLQALCRQVREFTPLLARCSLQGREQDHRRSSYWRKRTKADGQIDWRMSARSIHNLVRALAPPYLGAHCLIGGREIKVWRTEILTETPLDTEPGKILALSDKGAIAVKCGEEALWLHRHEFVQLPKVGDYL